MVFASCSCTGEYFAHQIFMLQWFRLEFVGNLVCRFKIVPPLFRRCEQSGFPVKPNASHTLTAIHQLVPSLPFLFQTAVLVLKLCNIMTSTRAPSEFECNFIVPCFGYGCTYPTAR